MQVLAIKKESEKVANTVATFLSEYSNDFQVPISRVEPENAINMVGTFLHKDNIGSQFKRVIGCSYQQIVFECVKVKATKTEFEKVASTVATFLTDDRYKLFIKEILPLKLLLITKIGDKKYHFLAIYRSWFYGLL